MFKAIRRMYSNLKTFDNLDTLNQYLLANKFPMTLVYFRANWNPNCLLTDQHIVQIASENRGLQCIKIDSDVAPKIAKHYGVKAQPQFVFCLYGDEVIRQTGPNYDGLVKKLQKMNQLAQNTDLSQFPSKWIPYGSKFQQYYQSKLRVLYKKNINL